MGTADRKTIENDLEFLRQISTEIDFEKDDYMEYINKLKEYCLSHTCYAMAPVQIGIPKRIIYIKNSKENMNNNIKEGYNEGIIYINPVIISSKGKTSFLEGCESCIYMKDNKMIYYTGVVERPYSIEIEYYDINNKKHRKTIEDFEATVFSHEFDHLNGVLHIDKSEETFEMYREEMLEYRKNNPYKVISKE